MEFCTCDAAGDCIVKRERAVLLPIPFLCGPSSGQGGSLDRTFYSIVVQDQNLFLTVIHKRAHLLIPQ